MSQTRELFASRLGFILMTAGCAIGLGNVWRFPYIVGKYGGGLFVLIYLLFLIIFGLPVLLMELAIGRAARSTFPGSFRALQNPQSPFKWQIPSYIFFAGNIVLLMFYSVVSGWLLAYIKYSISGELSAGNYPQVFVKLRASPGEQTLYMLLIFGLSVAICFGGIRKTIEKSIKFMMGGLFLLLVAMVIKSLSLPNAWGGVRFFLQPDSTKLMEYGTVEIIYAAVAQAFFTLSVGIGSIAICGSYMPKENSLIKEGFWIIGLDTTIAICSGLIIFPACAAFNITPDAGPNLIFITLPNVFQSMPGGNIWSAVFFLFLVIAALSTLVAVFENLVAFGMDEYKWSRVKSAGIFGTVVAILSLPCIFGFNLWQSFKPFGEKSNILNLEDFIVSNNLLPLGAIYLVIFCTNRYGWGKKNCMLELFNGQQKTLPKLLLLYLKYVLPAIILGIWALGIGEKFKLF